MRKQNEYIARAECLIDEAINELFMARMENSGAVLTMPIRELYEYLKKLRKHITP